LTRGDLGILQTLYLKIYWTFHRGVRHRSNPSLHSEYPFTFLDTPDSENLDHFVHSEHTEHSHHFEAIPIVCSTRKLVDAQQYYVYLKAFPISYEDKVKDWLYYLAP